MVKRIGFMLALAGAGALIWSAPLDSGVWMQTSSTAGDCAGCALEVRAPSAQLREVHASNGWVAFLRYETGHDRYTGFMELTREPDAAGRDWRGHVFLVTAVVEGHTLTIHARVEEAARMPAAAPAPEFRATYRRRD